MVTTPPKPRVMVDANILLAGSVWPRWPHEVLLHAVKGDFQLVLSPYIINEARRHVKRRFPDHVAEFEEILELCGYEEVPDPTREQVAANAGFVRDPKDIPVALAAINANVDCLVSEDKDLTAQDETTADLRKQLTVYLSGTFLRHVMGWSGKDLERVRGRTWRDVMAAKSSEEE